MKSYIKLPISHILIFFFVLFSFFAVMDKDVFAVTIIEDFESAIFPPTQNFSFSWTTGGSFNWAEDASSYSSAFYSAGVDPLQGDDEDSWIDLDYTCLDASGCQICWDWRVSSEVDYDFCNYCEDIDGTCDRLTYTGTANNHISGDGAWHTLCETFTQGAHSFRWFYGKDSAQSFNDNKCYIDNISIADAGVLLSPSSFSVSTTSCTGVSATWVDNSTDEDGFKVDRRRNGVGGWTNVCDIFPGDTDISEAESCTFTNSLDGAEWEYQLYAYNGGGDSNPIRLDTLSQNLCSPSGISLSGDGTCRNMTVSWNDNSTNEDRYEILFVDPVDTTDTHDERWIVDSNVTQKPGTGARSTTINNLIDGVDWDVTIRAYNDDTSGHSSLFDEAATYERYTILCDPITFETETSFGCDDASGLWRIYTRWEDISVNEDSYYFRWNDGGSWNNISGLPIDTGEWYGDFPPSDTYNFQVRAVNAFATSDWLPPDPTPAPVSVGACTASANFGSNYNICVDSVAWAGYNATDNCYVYDPRPRIRWSSTQNSFATDTALGSTGVGLDSITAVLPGDSYDYEPGNIRIAAGVLTWDETFTVSISAIDNNGLAISHDEDHTTPSQCLPARPNNFTITQDSCTEVTASWQDLSNNEDGFYVYRRRNDAGLWGVPVCDIPGDTSSSEYESCTITNDPDGAPWRYRVVAYNDGGESLQRLRWFYQDLCFPDNISLSGDGTCNNMTIDWDDNSTNEDQYLVTYEDLDNGANTLTWPVLSTGAEKSGTGARSFTKDDLLDGVHWRVSIRAYNSEGGAGGQSSPASAVIEYDRDTIICAPTGLSVSNSPLDCTWDAATDFWTFQVDWDDNSDNESMYYIQWRNDTDGGGFVNEITIPGTFPPFVSQTTPSNFPPSKTYSFRVQARNDQFVSTWGLPEDTEGVSHTVTACNADIKIINDDEYDCDCIDLVWTTDGVEPGVNDVDHYNIYRITSGNVYGDDDGSSPIFTVGNAPTTDPNIYEYQDCDIVSGAVSYSYRVETCFNPACTVSLSSFVEALDGVANNPCQDLPRWEESR